MRELTMVKAASSPLLRFIRNLVDDQQMRDLPDQELLQRFNSHQDQAAFQALLRRHGSMVFDICRCVLGDHAGAEDAFQATFLVLARKASSIRNTASVGSWIHGVAYRTALRARLHSSLRQKREALAPPRCASAPDDLSWREVRQVLHEELRKLPERYRAPLVLCFLEGATQGTAARQLKIAKSTLRVRLEQGRGLLRQRLIRRGLGSSALLAVAAYAGPSASASVPLILISSTIEAAVMFAANGAVTTAVSSKVISLAQGVVEAMFITKIKVLTAALLVVLVGVGGMLKLAPLAAGEPGVDKPVKLSGVKRLQPKRAATWQIESTLQGRGGQIHCVAFSPDGTCLAFGCRNKTVVHWDVGNKDISKPVNTAEVAPIGEIRAIAFSPDSKTLAMASGLTEEEIAINLWEFSSSNLKEFKDHSNPIHSLSFSKDGKTLISTSSPIDMTLPHNDRGQICFWNLEAKAKMAALKSDLVFDAFLSHDRKKLLTAGSGRDGTVKLWKIDEKFASEDETALVRDQICCLAVSADGKSFATAPVSGWSSVITVWDFDTGKEVISFEHKTGSVRCLAFAPDGKTLVTGGWTTTKRETATDKKDAVVADLAGEIKFWDVATGDLKQTLNLKSPVTSLAFSPDGRRLAVALLHNDKLTTKKEGGFETPPSDQKGVVVICELKPGKS